MKQLNQTSSWIDGPGGAKLVSTITSGGKNNSLGRNKIRACPLPTCIYMPESTEVMSMFLELYCRWD